MSRIKRYNKTTQKWEYADVATPSVKDVQVDGTSIVDGGVANIKQADQDTYGLVKYSINGGIATNSAGQLVLNDSSKSNIDTRFPYKPLTGANLDYAVKAALTDGKGTAYTDAEKRAARERIGLGGDFELIASVTLSEAVTEVIINTDMNGNAFEVSHFLIDVLTKPSENSSCLAVWNENNKYIAEANNAFASSGKAVSIFSQIVNGARIVFSSDGAANSTTATYIRSFSPIAKTNDMPHFSETIKGFKFKNSYSFNYLIPEGTVFNVYGVRV